MAVRKNVGRGLGIKTIAIGTEFNDEPEGDGVTVDSKNKRL